MTLTCYWSPSPNIPWAGCGIQRHQAVHNWRSSPNPSTPKSCFCRSASSCLTAKGCHGAQGKQNPPYTLERCEGNSACMYNDVTYSDDPYSTYYNFDTCTEIQPMNIDVLCICMCLLSIWVYVCTIYPLMLKDTLHTWQHSAYDESILESSHAHCQSPMCGSLKHSFCTRRTIKDEWPWMAIKHHYMHKVAIAWKMSWPPSTAWYRVIEHETPNGPNDHNQNR